MKNKVVFMGSPDFALPTLKALLEDEDFEVSLVISQPDKRRGRNKLLPTPVKACALEAGIPVETPKSINSQEMFDRLDEINPDFLVVIAYGQFIGKRLLERFPNRFINMHASLLPAYRGAAPIQFALLNGEKKTGVSAMLMERGMDTGDVLATEETEIGENEQVDTVHDRLADLAAKLTLRTLKNYDALMEERTEQDDEKATYASKLTSDMGHLNFQDSVQKNLNKINALLGWPSAYFYYNDQKVKVHLAHEGEKRPGEAGQVLKEDGGISILCADGTLVLDEIQFPNKRRMRVEDYLRGNDWDLNAVIH